MNVMGRRTTAKGTAYAQLGKKSANFCFQKSGSAIMVLAHSARPRNCM